LRIKRTAESIPDKDTKRKPSSVGSVKEKKSNEGSRQELQKEKIKAPRAGASGRGKGDEKSAPDVRAKRDNGEKNGEQSQEGRSLQRGLERSTPATRAPGKKKDGNQKKGSDLWDIAQNKRRLSYGGIGGPYAIAIDSNRGPAEKNLTRGISRESCSESRKRRAQSAEDSPPR